MTKKIITLSFMIMFFSSFGKTQVEEIFNDDFNNGIQNWTILDEDGDGKNWISYDTENEQGKSLLSYSYNEDAQSFDSFALTPDNWAIAGPFDLSSYTNQPILLTWKAYSHSQHLAQEKYSVYISSGDSVSGFINSNVFFNETIGATGSNVWVNRRLNASSFAGQNNIYIAFRHHNVTNQYGIHIDDVNLFIPYENDIKLVSHSIQKINKEEEITISGIVENKGNANISSFELSYNNGTDEVTETISTDIPSGESYNFELQTPLNLIAEKGPYNIKICATIENDGDSSNNCLIANTIVLKSNIDKYIVLEEKTGTWCQYCPHGTAIIDNLKLNDSNLIGIAIHNNDPMALTPYDKASDSFPNFKGYPYIATDRIIGDRVTKINGLYNSRKQVQSYASVNVFHSITGDNIHVTATVKPVANIIGNYSVAVVLIEDNVKGNGYNWLQANGYAGKTTSILHHINDTTFDYKDLSNPVDISNLMGGYDHVARALGDNKINGVKESLPDTMLINEEYSHTYYFTKGASWNLENVYAVAMFINNETGEIINAGQNKKALGIETKEFDFPKVTLFPNPSNGFSNLTLSLNKSSKTKINIIDINGKIVFKTENKNLTTGIYNYSLNLSNFINGIYFVKIKIDDHFKIFKLVLNK